MQHLTKTAGLLWKLRRAAGAEVARIEPALGGGGRFLAGQPVGPGHDPIVVLRHEIQRQAELLEIVQIHRPVAALFGLVQRRHQHGRQNRNDGNDHQQLNQGEGRGGGAVPRACIYV